MFGAYHELLWHKTLTISSSSIGKGSSEACTQSTLHYSQLCQKDCMQSTLHYAQLCRWVTSVKVTEWVEDMRHITRLGGWHQTAFALANMELKRMMTRSKHIAVKYPWFRPKAQVGDIIVMESSNQVADVFTKGLSWCFWFPDFFSRAYLDFSRF